VKEITFGTKGGIAEDRERNWRSFRTLESIVVKKFEEL